MFSSGIQKNNYHLKDFSYERTFGALSTQDLPIEYNADLGGFPDQNEDGRPNGCSGYTQAETGQDEYGVVFNPGFNYEKTLLIAGSPPNSPCKIRDALKAPTIYGLEPKEGGNPLEYRRGAYFDVDKVEKSYFEGVRSALWLNRLNKRTISCGTPWFREWRTPKNGVLETPKKYVWDTSTIGHNYKICGWKLVSNKPHLIIKPWVGPDWGDKGYAYISKDVFDKVMAISGTFMYIQTNYTPDYVQTVKLDILELTLTLCRRLLNVLSGR